MDRHRWEVRGGRRRSAGDGPRVADHGPTRSILDCLERVPGPGTETVVQPQAGPPAKATAGSSNDDGNKQGPTAALLAARIIVGMLDKVWLPSCMPRNGSLVPSSACFGRWAEGSGEAAVCCTAHANDV